MYQHMLVIVMYGQHPHTAIFAVESYMYAKLYVDDTVHLNVRLSHLK